MDGWNDFFVATTSAAAALSGLIFVGVSISLKKILLLNGLADRALVSILLLINILAFSLLLLVPDQSDKSVGIKIFIISSISWMIISWLDVKIYKTRGQAYKRSYLLLMFINQAALVLYMVCGIAVSSNGDSGMIWMVPAILISFIKSIIDAWVLLVEIHR